MTAAAHEAGRRSDAAAPGTAGWLGLAAAPTFAVMALLTCVPDEGAVAIMCENVDHIVQVSDDEVRAAMKTYFVATHNVVEGAGAASLAAALQEKDKLAGRRVGIVATGGNVDHDVFAAVLNPAVLNEQAH